MSIPINEAILPAIAMVEFNDGEKKKITIHAIETDNIVGKEQRGKRASFYPRNEIKKINIQSDQLSAEQRRVLDELKKGDATASQLGCGMRTLFSLQSFGLVENMERFGTSEVQGKERTKVYWRYVGNEK